MESGFRLVAIWLLALRLIASVLFADSFIFYNNHIGRINVSKYAQEHSDDLLAAQENTNCAKVTYPSLTIFYAPVDPNFTVGAKFNHGQYMHESFGSHVTVNHHGKLNQVTFSGPVNGFATMEGFGDVDMYVCVHKEYIEGVSEIDLEPEVSIDWISFYNKLSASVDSLHLQNVSVTHNSVYCTVLPLAKMDSKSVSSTLLFSVQPKDIYFYSNENAAWIGSYETEEVYQGLSHRVSVCTYISTSNTDFAGESTVMMTLSIIFEGTTVNYGAPETPNSYLTENGNIKLEVIGNDASNWTLICTDKPFEQNYSSIPYVFISVSFRDKPEEELNTPILGWVEFVNEIGFRACVGLPHYADGIASNASTAPYLEYLVISQDGIYDQDIQPTFDSKFFVTLELLFPTSADLFVETFDQYVTSINYIMHKLAPDLCLGEFWNYGYISQPSSSHKVYLFLSYNAENKSKSAYLSSQLAEQFSDGYFPYISDIQSVPGAALMNAMYPNGAPQCDSKKIGVQFWTGWGCPVGPFSSGVCSSAKCEDNSTGGVKTIARMQTTENPSAHCPALSIEVACNLPPCSTKEQTFFAEPSTYEEEQGGEVGEGGGNGTIVAPKIARLIKYTFWFLVGIISVSVAIIICGVCCRISVQKRMIRTYV